MTIRTAWLLAFALVLGASSGTAKDFKVGDVEIKDPWIAATPRGAPVAGGYLILVNRGRAADRLTGGSLSIADRFEIHRTTLEQGVARMRPVAGGLEIRPGETVELKPGAVHVMFVGLKQAVEQGRTIKGTLTFEKAGAVEIEYRVEPIGGAAARPRHNH